MAFHNVYEVCMIEYTYISNEARAFYDHGYSLLLQTELGSQEVISSN